MIEEIRIFSILVMAISGILLASKHPDADNPVMMFIVLSCFTSSSLVALFVTGYRMTL